MQLRSEPTESRVRKAKPMFEINESGSASLSQVSFSAAIYFSSNPEGHREEETNSR